MFTGEPAFDAQLLRNGVTAVDLDIARRLGAHVASALAAAVAA